MTQSHRARRALVGFLGVLAVSSTSPASAETSQAQMRAYQTMKQYIKEGKEARKSGNYDLMVAKFHGATEEAKKCGKDNLMLPLQMRLMEVDYLFAQTNAEDTNNWGRAADIGKDRLGLLEALGEEKTDTYKNTIRQLVFYLNKANRIDEARKYEAMTK